MPQAGQLMDTAEFQRLTEGLADRYRFEDEIGRGGWGVVYRATDLRHSRAVAIKVLLVDAAGPDARERFLQEIVLESQIVHPHIVPIFDSGELGSALFFVMPFVDGESLQHRLEREAQLPITDAVRIASDVADALAHAHSLGIIHRDIKPGNILLAAGGAVVADFGIARALKTTDGGLFVTASGMRLGTPAYMAPEQAAGDPDVDGRADIYSLGCVLFQMLAGRPPFEATNAATVIARHAIDPVPRLRTVRPRVSPALEAVVDRALAKAPADRFQDAAQFVEALDEVLHSESASGPHFRPRRTRRRLALAATSALLVLASAWVTREAAARGEARAIARADTSRIVLFPFEGDPRDAGATDGELRRALSRWSGVTLEDAFVVRDAVGTSALSSRRAVEIAIRLGARRFIRGSITRSDAGTELSAVLTSVENAGRALTQVNARLPADETLRDSVLNGIADQLLLRSPLPPDLPRRGLETRSLAAAQHYLAGRAAIQRWDLDFAVLAFGHAWEADDAFQQAALWLAQSRYWREDPETTWRLPAQAVARDTLARNSRAAAVARALLAMAGPDPGAACDVWSPLTRSATFEFAIWYSAAVCRDRDNVVVRDRASPSGWRFRSSYHTALQDYFRAYQLLPSIHRALREQSFERVRMMLYVNHNALRQGRAQGTGATLFAHPALHGDTLVFIPYPPAQILSADVQTTRAHHDAGLIVQRRQRELFRDIAGTWVTAEPSSPDAREAQAIALQLLGESAALDTLARAISLAQTPEARRRLAGTEVWLRVRYALPDDLRSLRRARVLADSLLRQPVDADDRLVAASLAALFGREAETRALVSDAPHRFAQRFREPLAPVATAAIELEIAAALGMPATSLQRREERLDSLVTVLIPAEQHERARAELFVRAAALAWPIAPLSIASMAPAQGSDLVRAIVNDVRGDSTAARAGLATLTALRAAWPPRSTTFDALLPEAYLAARHGQVAQAVAWLDEALAAQRMAPPDFDPAQAAAFVRAMALRAELAHHLGDRAAARRWAAAVAELWQEADAPLQPLVRRMRQLAQ